MTLRLKLRDTSAKTPCKLGSGTGILANTEHSPVTPQEQRATRFKGLVLIDRVPEEIWMEVCDTVQETEIKTIPKKKKCQKAKWSSKEALQIAEKRREAKGKGEKEIYTHLNVEFQRIVWRNKKAFLLDQRKEIEENNRMGKTRDLIKKIRDTKGTFHAKMGTIKDRNDTNKSRRY